MLKVVPLPDVSRLALHPGVAFTRKLREEGLVAREIRRLTEREDNLRRPLVPTREASLRDDNTAVLLRLFFCGEAVTCEAAAAALDPLFASTLACGLLVAEEPAHVRAPFHLRTVADLYLISDYLDGDPVAVMGAGETTAILYRAGLPSHQVGRALDLGCGAGTLTLLLARSAREVIGADINPRAIALAQANAGLNGIANATFRAGDLYAPVNGERFDLILSQPPYYPTPPGGTEQVFLHGGILGDELSRRVVEGLTEHLTPQGRAVLFTSWPELSNAAAGDHLRVLELQTSRAELQGTRQSINVIEPATAGEGWSVRLTVPADLWGEVTSARINELLANQHLLHGPPALLLAARVQRTAGIAIFQEGTQHYLRGPAEALIGVAPVSPEMAALLASLTSPTLVSNLTTALPLVREALARGFLVFCGEAAG